jgi:hypothetical protein
MITRSPVGRYWIAHFLARLCDEEPSSAELPPRPDKVEAWELRAALSMVLEEMRLEFASLGSRVTCHPDLRRKLDCCVDQALTRIESAIDRI